MLLRLSRMLDKAMAGTFSEQNFDESLLSAVEAKLVHYLAANAVPAQKLREAEG